MTDSCTTGCPRFDLDAEDEEMCIDGRLRSGPFRVDDEGPCPCYCHSTDDQTNGHYDGNNDE